MRTLPRSHRLFIALVAVVSLVRPLPAAAAPAPLPNWDVDKSGKKPEGKKPEGKPADTAGGKGTAPLPDWGVTGKGKPDDKGKKGKPGKGKGKKGKPGTKPDEPTESTPTEPTPPDEVAPEPTPGEPATPEPTTPTTPTEPAAPVGPAPAPEPEPAVTSPADDTAAAEQLRLRGRAELITGAVFMVGGLTGFGVLGAGVVVKGRAEQELKDAEGRTDVDLEPLDKQQKQGETMLAAGAVAGVLGMALGIALVAAGGRDMKAGRAGLTSRVRIAPTFGGLVISGRF